MAKLFKTNIPVFIFSLGILIVASCKNQNDSKNDVVEADFVSSMIDGSGSVHSGDTIVWNVLCTDTTIKIDSAIFSLDGKPITQSNILPQSLRIQSDGYPLGQHLLTADVYAQGKLSTKTVGVMIFAKQEPLRFKCRPVKSYPHDAQSYTQGLEFVGDELLESSGQYGASGIRYISLNNSKPRIVQANEPNIFGEGCTVLHDKVYQLSWKELTCFIYDVKTLKPIGSFKYPVAIEGWGLTNDGKHLIMTDGTNKMYFIDPAHPEKVVQSISVYTNIKPVDQLNELEWVNGMIYANVYTTDEIVRIDPKTGAVTAIIDASGLLSDEDRVNAEVLNGIAYHPKKKALFITGKYWPKIFEVELAKGI